MRQPLWIATTLLRKELSRIGRGKRQRLGVYEEAEHAHPADISRHWTWPHAWNFLIYSCNLRFWSLLTLRGRCHWNIVALRRLLVLLPGDISFKAVHRADCSQTSVFAMYRAGREEKSRVSNISSVIFQMVLILMKYFIYFHDNLSQNAMHLNAWNCGQKYSIAKLNIFLIIFIYIF